MLSTGMCLIEAMFSPYQKRFRLCLVHCCYEISQTCACWMLQEVLIWLTKVREQVGDNITEEQMKEFVWNTLKSGQVHPHFTFLL